MKQPKVKVNGQVFNVDAVNWCQGGLSFVAYDGPINNDIAFYNQSAKFWSDVNGKRLEVELLTKEELQHA